MHVLDLLLSDLAPSLCVCEHPRGRQQLHAVAKTCLWADFSEVGEGLGGELDVFCWGSDGQDLHEFFEAVVGGLDDEQSVEQIDWDSVGRDHVGAANGADASIGGEHDDGGECGL